MNTPRGIRNNNPGNVKHFGVDWVGLVDESERIDNTFCEFTHPWWGIRALARILRNYYYKRNLTTVAEIIGRYAPKGDRNDESAYAGFVARSIGVQPDDELPAMGFTQLRDIIPAIIKFENGVQPYEQGEILTGIVLEGTEPKEVRYYSNGDVDYAD